MKNVIIFVAMMVAVVGCYDVDDTEDTNMDAETTDADSETEITDSTDKQDTECLCEGDHILICGSQITDCKDKLPSVYTNRELGVCGYSSLYNTATCMIKTGTPSDL
jgi:hypothetical protein